MAQGNNGQPDISPILYPAMLSPLSGVVALTAGTATVVNNQLNGGVTVQVTSQADGGTPGWLRVTAVTEGVNGSFTITSSSDTDSSTVGWLVTPGQ